MALIWCREISGKDRSTDISIEVSSGKFIRRYVRVFLARTDNRVGEGVQVIAWAQAAGQLPSLGALYTDFNLAVRDTEAWLQKITCADTGPEGFDHTITCTYSSEKEIWSNPLSEPATYVWDASPSQDICIKHRAGPNVGKIVLNTNKELFNPPVPVDSTVWGVTVQKNVAVVPSWVTAYNQPINTTQFTIGGLAIPVRCARLNTMGIPAAQKRNGFIYYPMTLRILFNWFTWIHYEPARAFTQLVGDETEKIQLLDGAGGFPNEPWPLDANGAALSDADKQDLDEWYFIPVYKYPELDFNSLPLW